MLSPFPRVTGGIVTPWKQTAGPAIAGKLLDLLAFVLRLRLMRSKLFNCSRVITGKKLDSASNEIKTPIGPHRTILTEKLAIDCEIMRSNIGQLLGRVSVVNYNSETIFDTFGRPWWKWLDGANLGPMGLQRIDIPAWILHQLA